MLAKVVNGRLITPSEAEKQKIVITNPAEASLKFNLGYKDLTVDETPTYDPKTQTIKSVLEETETTIIQHWEVADIVEEAENSEE